MQTNNKKNVYVSKCLRPLGEQSEWYMYKSELTGNEDRPVCEGLIFPRYQWTTVPQLVLVISQEFSEKCIIFI